MSGSDSGAFRLLSAIIARTIAAGFALINGTTNIVTLNTPNDGGLHSYNVAVNVNVTLLETGGAIVLNWTAGGQAMTASLSAGGLAVGQYASSQAIVADPNTAVTVRQSTALTAGTANAVVAITGG